MCREKHYDHLKHNYTYIGDNIKLADTKATVALGANTVILGFLGKETKKILNSENIFNHDFTLTETLMLCSIFSLMVSIYFFVWKVLWPRYSKDDNEDYLSWSGIANFKDSQSYTKHLKKSIQNIESDMASQVYHLAIVSLEKYKNLKYGFTFLTIGTLIGGVCWFFLL